MGILPATPLKVVPRRMLAHRHSFRQYDPSPRPATNQGRSYSPENNKQKAGRNEHA